MFSHSSCSITKGAEVPTNAGFESEPRSKASCIPYITSKKAGSISKPIILAGDESRFVTIVLPTTGSLLLVDPLRYETDLTVQLMRENSPDPCGFHRGKNSWSV